MVHRLHHSLFEFFAIFNSILMLLHRFQLKILQILLFNSTSHPPWKL